MTIDGRMSEALVQCDAPRTRQTLTTGKLELGMTMDPRCCGSGTCIVDPAGRCWCGQQWDGEKMCNPEPTAKQDSERQPESRATGPLPDDRMERAGSSSDKPAVTPASAVRQRLRIGFGRRWLSMGFVLTALLLTLTLPMPASAAAVAERDARAVRAVIEAQLQAFTGGDAQSAFSYASVAIRTQFGDAASFMSMVQAGYPMLVQPATMSFFVPEWAGGTLLQKVQLRDRAGMLWMAAYQLQRQADATWRINGCVVVSDSGKSST